MKKIILLLIILLVLPTVLAINKPLSINPFGNSIEGTSCTQRYAITGNYCSGNTLRVYYQCLPTNEGLVWQKRSEDCTLQNGLCYNGECRTKKSYFLTKTLILLGIIILSYVLYKRWRRT